MSFSQSIPMLAPDERPEPSLGPRVWAGAILMLASLGFFFLAGCFAIGILEWLNPGNLNGVAPTSPLVLSGEEATFVVTLYVLVGLSVLASGVLFFVGLVGLVRILQGKTGTS
jgi:hypothetical protein